MANPELREDFVPDDRATADDGIRLRTGCTESRMGGIAADLSTAIASSSHARFVLRPRQLRGRWGIALTMVVIAAMVAFGSQIGQGIHGSAEASLRAASLLVVFVAAFVSSIAGFAFSPLAAAPLLYLYADPVRAVEIMLVCSITIQCYSVLKLRRDIAWHTLVPFLLGGLPAVPVGVALLTRISPDSFAIVLGAFLVCYGTYSVIRPTGIRARSHFLLDVSIGALGGIIGGLTAFPGALMCIWCGMKGWTKEQQRAIYQPYILMLQITALMFLRTGAPVHNTADGLALHIPVVLLAACGGFALFKALTNRQFNVVVHALLIASGFFLLTKAI